MRVFVAGKGVITAIGNNVAENLLSLTGQRSGISKMEVLKSAYAATLPVGEVKFSNAELTAMAGLPPKASRTALLSAIAAKEALFSASIPNLEKLRKGFISANTVGGMDTTELIYSEFMRDGVNAELKEAKHEDSGVASELVADVLGIKHHITTISTACSSSANTIMYGARLIKAGLLDVAVAGGTDALSKFTLNGFNSLMILDNKPCTPYDENRRGLNLGEGAGYIVLVSEKVAATLAVTPSTYVSGYANANDAYHQTASSPDGTGNYLAMQGALRTAGLQPASVDYINLHGTGTANNDLAEGIAIQRVFGEQVPPCSSTKSYTGHTLGACGGVEAVYSILGMEEGVIFPTLRYATPMKELNFKPVTELVKGVTLKHVMSNSFGFGGNCSSLIFSRA